MASVAFPCPQCEYDLRGLNDGRCPECGVSFRVKDLTPEQPGLVLEGWVEEARCLGRRAMLPGVIAFSPSRAFRRRCRLEKTLATSPARVILWILVWYVFLLLISVAVQYTLNKVQGIHFVIGGHWNPSLGHRFGSAVLLPVHLPIAWLQCLVVSVIGMAIAARRLSAQQVVRLATWLLAFTLLGGLFTILYEPIWYRLITPWLSVRSFMWAFRMYDLGNELAYRGHDFVLGLIGGFAVGTVLQRRRWLIAIVSAAVLTAAFPVCLGVQRAYFFSVYEPARELVVGPRPIPPPRPMLLRGPTFTVGNADPALAGTWTVLYDEEEQAPAELVFDGTGTLLRWKPQQQASRSGVAEFLADGLEHDIDPPEGASAVVRASYHVVSGCEQETDGIVIHLRIKRTYTRRLAEDFFEQMPDVVEETLTGVFDADGAVVTGTSVVIREVPGISFEPGQVERSFVMKRVNSTVPDSAP